MSETGKNLMKALDKLDEYLSKKNVMYTTKWLPVDGIPQEGDYYLDKEVVKKAEIPETFMNPHIEYYDGYKKVKLFLISHDIKPQDILNTLEQVHIFHDSSQPSFKVIGEISPEAMSYCKEGMELTEEEVEEWWGQATTHQPMIKKLDEEWDKELLDRKAPIVFTILGPCGHFH